VKKKYVIISICVAIIALIVVCGQVFTVRNISVVFYNKTGLADEADILEASGLDSRNNIFNVKESEIKHRIIAAFPDNSIVVTNVERKFPDEVVIYVKERTPIFKIEVNASSEEKSFVATDKDFQRGKIQKEEELAPLKLITVTGFVVNDSFDVKECVALRNVAKALLGKNMSEEALPYFIESINISDGELQIKLAETGAVLYVDMAQTADETAALYDRYLAMDYSARNNAVLRIKN